MTEISKDSEIKYLKTHIEELGETLARTKKLHLSENKTNDDVIDRLRNHIATNNEDFQTTSTTSEKKIKELEAIIKTQSISFQKCQDTNETLWREIREMKIIPELRVGRTITEDISQEIHKIIRCYSIRNKFLEKRCLELDLFTNDLSKEINALATRVSEDENRSFFQTFFKKKESKDDFQSQVTTLKVRSQAIEEITKTYQEEIANKDTKIKILEEQQRGNLSASNDDTRYLEMEQQLKDIHSSYDLTLEKYQKNKKELTEENGQYKDIQNKVNVLKECLSKKELEISKGKIEYDQLHKKYVNIKSYCSELEFQLNEEGKLKNLKGSQINEPEPELVSEVAQGVESSQGPEVPVDSDPKEHPTKADSPTFREFIDNGKSIINNNDPLGICPLCSKYYHHSEMVNHFNQCIAESN